MPDHAAPLACPICDDRLRVSRLDCPGCGTGIEGAFALSGLAGLSREQIAFAEVFLRNRGVIKDVEVELGVSYPTIRARLDDLVQALGPSAAAATARPADRRERRRAILRDLRSGRISTGDAADLLSVIDRGQEAAGHGDERSQR